MTFVDYSESVLNPISPVITSTLYTVHPAFEDGTDTGFRNVGQLQFDAGEIPGRIYTIFKSRRKSEIKNTDTDIDNNVSIFHYHQ